MKYMITLFGRMGVSHTLDFSISWTSTYFRLDLDKCWLMKCFSSTKCKALKMIVGKSDVGRSNLFAISDVFIPCLKMIDRCLKVTNNAGKPLLTSANRCMQGMNDGKRPYPTLAD